MPARVAGRSLPPPLLLSSVSLSLSRSHAPRLLSFASGLFSQVCTNALGNQPFVHAKVATWTTTIIENVLKELAVKNDEAAKKGPDGQKYKFVVNAQLQQNVGSAMVTATAAYWEKATDSFLSVKWESEAVQVLVTIYGVAV